ncbi:hypothetical protein RvY_03961 [Ramazzottius varieornatus]|uniref:BTB domain-containing protein n=1 Tax=Ramazzottius varieornatus TaxID=947166 RepID=A0A1D1UTG9_RAMVA|nr:hypothetical protein RvY_03961 [Ramazzottius varieornatus]
MPVLFQPPSHSAMISQMVWGGPLHAQIDDALELFVGHDAAAAAVVDHALPPPLNLAPDVPVDPAVQAVIPFEAEGNNEIIWDIQPVAHNHQGLAALAGWLAMHQNQHHHAHPPAPPGGHHFQLEEEEWPELGGEPVLPAMHGYGQMPEDLMTLFQASASQELNQHSATLRMLKKRILMLRERKPHYWHRVAFALYKRTLRGASGGCDVRFVVQSKSVKKEKEKSTPTAVWGHKFILASNPVFRQLFGYQIVEDCLQDEEKLTEIDIPSITSEAMRSIVMSVYDLPVQKLSLESARYLEYWAMHFCMDDLIDRCQKIIHTAPFR